MSNKLFSGENLPFIIIGAVSLIFVVIGVLLVSAGTPEPLDPEDKEKLLVRSNSNFDGPKDAEVVLVNFSDFQCPHCAQYVPIENQLKEEFGDKVKFVYRYYSINLSNPAAFPNGVIAADAAEAAREQGKFWEMHDIIFQKQQEWAELSKAKAQEKFSEYAKEIEVPDLDKFTKEMKDQKYREKIVQDFEDGKDIGVTGTPTVYLNGEQVEDRSYEALSSSIKNLLNQE